MSIPIDVSTLDATILSNNPPPPYTPSPSTTDPVIVIPQPAVIATPFPRGTTIAEFLNPNRLSASSTTLSAFHSRRANAESLSLHRSSIANPRAAQILSQLVPNLTGPALPPSANASAQRNSISPNPIITDQPTLSPPPCLPPSAPENLTPAAPRHRPVLSQPQCENLRFILCCPCICTASIVLGTVELIGKGIMCVLGCYVLSLCGMSYWYAGDESEGWRSGVGG